MVELISGGVQQQVVPWYLLSNWDRPMGCAYAGWRGLPDESRTHVVSGWESCASAAMVRGQQPERGEAARQAAAVTSAGPLSGSLLVKTCARVAFVPLGVGVWTRGGRDLSDLVVRLV